MPERNYRIYLDDENDIFVYFETMQGEVIRFVVKYLAMIDGIEYEVLRFDTAHRSPHIDILDPLGNKKQKIFLPRLTNKEALNYAQDDIKQHYKQYRERFIVWKNDLEK
jgi:hypothetical protein